MLAPHLTVGWVYGLDSAPSSTDARKIIAIAVAFSAISLLSILVRFTQRWTLLHTIGLDDVAAAGSMLLEWHTVHSRYIKRDGDLALMPKRFLTAMQWSLVECSISEDLSIV